MSLISKNKLNLVKKLYYEDSKSMSEVGKYLGVSLDAVTYFMRQNGLKRRTLKESRHMSFKNKPLSFKIKKKLSKDDEILKAIGVSLYWGEGYKAKKAMGVDFANSDADMIRTFLKFLRKICGIDENRLVVYIYCYSNQNIKKVINYWGGVTNINKDQFSKPYIRNDFRLEKKTKMPYGLVHIRYSDKKLLFLIRKWIDDCKCR